MAAWQVALIVLVAIPMLILWGAAFVDMFRRADLPGIKIATWIVLILIFPFIGAITYFLVRPEAPALRGNSRPRPEKSKRQKAAQGTRTPRTSSGARSSGVKSSRRR